MRRAPAALLCHRGQGPRHFDLIIGYGRRCPTIRLQLDGRLLRMRWAAPHRRHYLSYRGPVSAGRGVVERTWYGLVHWTTDWCRMGPYGLNLGRKAVVPERALRTLLRT